MRDMRPHRAPLVLLRAALFAADISLIFQSGQSGECFTLRGARAAFPGPPDVTNPGGAISNSRQWKGGRLSTVPSPTLAKDSAPEERPYAALRALHPAPPSLATRPLARYHFPDTPRSWNSLFASGAHAHTRTRGGDEHTYGHKRAPSQPRCSSGIRTAKMARPAGP